MTLNARSDGGGGAGAAESLDAPEARNAERHKHTIVAGPRCTFLSDSTVRAESEFDGLAVNLALNSSGHDTTSPGSTTTG